MAIVLTVSRVVSALFVVLIGGLWCTTAYAMSLRELRALEKSGKEATNYANYYLVGVMEGTLAAQSQGVRNGAKSTICQNGRRLLPSMARGMFETELQRNTGVYEADMPVQLVVSNALETVYPC